MRSVLLLRHVQRPLTAIEQFLANRGFKVHIVHNVSEAIQFISSEKVDFALFSADLIPPGSAWIFGILSQVTNPILFAERISARTIAISQEHRDLYFIEPPLTPIVVEQMLRRVTRDQLKQSQSASQLDNTQVLIMSALSDLALNAMAKPAPNTPKTETVERTKRITCFRVQTMKMSGYFVMAYGQDRQLDAKWTEGLQQQLKQFLASVDDKSMIDPSEELMIEEVNFSEWSKDRAEFVRRTNLQDAELVMAFFKDVAEEPVRDSQHPGHVEMKLNQVAGDSVLNFDVYIYLPQNARFVLYTPKGGTLFESQKQKLQSEGIHTVHINKRHLTEVRRHRTQSFVKESAAAFRN